MALNFANNNSLSAITSLPASISGGGMTLISTQTASSSATIDFTSGIDSTYKEYQVHYTDCHPATDSAHLQINFRDGGSNFDATKTTTVFRAYHQEDDGQAVLGYSSGEDLAQSTSNQQILNDVGADNDQSCVGIVKLFEPSSTTFVKHRDQAYVLSRYIIEEIKKRSPIWKKEHYENEESEWLKGNPIANEKI